MTEIIAPPDLSSRPHALTVTREMQCSAAVLYAAWTLQFDHWFAAPGSLLIQGIVNTPFFWVVEAKPPGTDVAQRHPHYGRFLRLDPDRLVELTWVTGAGGTNGAETVVTVELTPRGDGASLKLIHAGFATAEARDNHQHAWPFVLEQLDQKMQMRGAQS